MGIWNTWFHKQATMHFSFMFLIGLRIGWLAGWLIGWGSFVACFQLCSDSWHTFYWILGSLGARSPSCSNSTFLPFLTYLHFSKFIPIFLTVFLGASAQLCVRAVYWLACGTCPLLTQLTLKSRLKFFCHFDWICVSLPAVLKTFRSLRSVSLQEFC